MISKRVNPATILFHQLVRNCGGARSHQSLVWLLVGIFLMTGCQGGAGGANPVAASGVITFNGKPVDGAHVVFIPEAGPQATATTDADGSFDLMTIKEKDGVVPGKCRVAVEKRLPLDPKNPYVTPESLIPERYSSIQESQLTETVDAGGENFFSIDLKD